MPTFRVAVDVLVQAGNDPHAGPVPIRSLSDEGLVITALIFRDRRLLLLVGDPVTGSWQGLPLQGGHEYGQEMWGWRARCPACAGTTDVLAWSGVWWGCQACVLGPEWTAKPRPSVPDLAAPEDRVKAAATLWAAVDGVDARQMRQAAEVWEGVMRRVARHHTHAPLPSARLLTPTPRPSSLPEEVTDGLLDPGPRK